MSCVFLVGSEGKFKSGFALLFLKKIFYSIILKFVFIYFWLHWVFIAVCRLSLTGSRRGYSLVVVCRLLIAVASLVQSSSCKCTNFSGRGTRAQ